MTRLLFLLLLVGCRGAQVYEPEPPGSPTATEAVPTCDEKGTDQKPPQAPAIADSGAKGGKKAPTLTPRQQRIKDRQDAKNKARILEAQAKLEASKHQPVPKKNDGVFVLGNGNETTAATGKRSQAAQADSGATVSQTQRNTGAMATGQGATATATKDGRYAALCLLLLVAGYVIGRLYPKRS